MACCAAYRHALQECAVERSFIRRAPPPRPLAVVRALLQDPLAGRAGGQRRQGAPEWRQGETRACRAGGRSHQPDAGWRAGGVRCAGPAGTARPGNAKRSDTTASSQHSVARRIRHREAQRLADLSRPRPDSRPDKRDRRRLVRFQRGEGWAPAPVTGRRAPLPPGRSAGPGTPARRARSAPRHPSPGNRTEPARGRAAARAVPRAGAPACRPR